jgi:pimeloyl-ACP methyl ester carboxylesterase
VLRLRDGRILGYAEYGDPTGHPALLFHGTPGSRLEGAIAHRAAAARGVRVICPDRPGYGLSDFKRRRSILDWADDVEELADALGIERFAVAGVSGGGPYAAACAVRLPRRLTGVAIISGVGPYDAPGATDGMMLMNRLALTLARRAPLAVRLFIWIQEQFGRRSPDRFLDGMIRGLTEPDRRVLARPEIRDLFKRDFAESIRHGSRGATREALLFARPWGFRLQDITVEVHLWQGEDDAEVPPSMGRFQAAAIPNCRAHFCPDTGHLLAITHVGEIIDALGSSSA